MQSHLALALIAATTGKSMLAISSASGVAQSTLSRLVREGRRIDPDTLRALRTHLDARAGAQILLGHLHDEITRAGDSVLNWDIEHRQAAGSDANDLAILEAAVAGPDRLPPEVADELAGMLHHLANLARGYRHRTTYPTDHASDQLEAAEDPPSPPSASELIAEALKKSKSPDSTITSKTS